jgi:hypothetical protein
MIIPESIKKFIRWVQGFDHHLLQNEDDVKEKFILPMFGYLCYPEKCYREYPLKKKIAIGCNSVHKVILSILLSSLVVCGLRSPAIILESALTLVFKHLRPR